MKLRSILPVLAFVTVLAGCGSGTTTSSTPSGGAGTATGSTSASTTTPAKAAPAGCKTVRQPAPKPNGKFKAPTKKLDSAKTWTATVKTNCGTFEFKLDLKKAPNAAASLKYLAGKRFFNRTIFHRIVPGFVIQGGDPTGSGSGGPG